MPTPTENRRKILKIQARVEPDSPYVPFLEQYRQSHHLKDKSQALLHIIDQMMLHDFQPYGEHLDLQKCKFHSEYPPKSDEFCKCRKDGWLKTIRTEQCVACSLYKVISIPLLELETIEKYIKDRGQELEKLRNTKKDLQAEVAQLKAETPIGFKKRIKELEDTINILSKRLTTTEGEIAALETDYGFLRRQMEIYPAKATEVFEGREVAPRPVSMERTIKEKETTEKVVFQTNQSNHKVQCPIKEKEVDIDLVCRGCHLFRICSPEYLSSLHSSDVDVNQ